MNAKSSAPTDERLTYARDVMTGTVASVRLDVPVPEIAKLLLEKRISAVPVVNDDGVPLGMVSEGDLVGRDERDRLARSDWWLAIVSGSQPLDDKFEARMQATDRTARDVMSVPLVTVTEETKVSEIARLLAIHHIKRVPVTRDGRLVGIVSRADLLRIVASGQTMSSEPEKDEHGGFLANLFGDYHLPVWETVAGNRPPEPVTKLDENSVCRGRLTSSCR